MIPRTRRVQRALVNLCCVCNKSADITEGVVMPVFDIVLTTENWQASGDAVKCAQLNQSDC